MTDRTTGIGTLAAEALELLIAAAEQTAPENWDRPSNLDGWSVREVVAHATGSAAAIVTLLEGGVTEGRSEPADWICEDPAARLRELAVRLRAALPAADLDAPRASPMGEVPLRQAIAFPVADLALHSWDTHRSQGRRAELPESLLGFCRELAESVPEPVLRQPGRFGPAQPVPPDATPTDRLLAYLGRPVGGRD